MKQLTRVIFSYAVILTLLTTAAQADQKVIYGEDDRKDIYEVQNLKYLNLAASTVALVKTGNLQQNSSGVVNIKADSFSETIGVCKTEKYADQPSGGFCSGALIGPNTILTAGHCIKNMSDCSSTKFVFGYAVTQKGKYPTHVPEQDVVGCANVLHTQAVNSGADFAIIKLDRKITHRKPAEMEKSRRWANIPNGTELVMIGHPAGLPTKVEDGGKVRDNSKSGFFIATTDSYGGNSGSSVFNKKTGKIEGVLVRGERDYTYENGCYVSNMCKEDGCRGEDVTKIADVIKELPREL